MYKMHNMKTNDPIKPRIYLDVTSINLNPTKKYIWQDSNRRGELKVPTGKGNTFVVNHAGMKYSFIPRCNWVLIYTKRLVLCAHHKTCQIQDK